MTERYGDDVVVWAIGSNDTLEDLQAFKEDLGLALPVLYDEDTAVLKAYGELGKARGFSAYPYNWLIGSDGRVSWFSTEYDPSRVEAAIDRALSGQ